MNPKLPYYMTYPMPFQFDEEKGEERDWEYLKGMYPLEAKKLLPYVENECDRMEYVSCMLYDEYPDKLQMQLMARRIIKNAGVEGELQHLAEVMLYQEVYERRCMHRKEMRKVY